MNRDEQYTTSIPAPDPSLTHSAGVVFDPKRFLSLRGFMMLTIVAVLGVPAVVATWFLVPVYHTATAQIRFLATDPFVLTMNSTNTSYSQFVNTQISLITGPAVLSRVLDNAEIRTIPSLVKDRDPLGYLSSRINARVRRLSEIVSITCSMEERDDARVVLEEVINVYLDYTANEEERSGLARLAMLTQERDARQLEQESQLVAIQNLQGALGIPIIGETPLDTGEGQLYNERLAQAEADLAAAQRAQERTQTQILEIDTILEHASKDKPIYEFGVEQGVSKDVRVSVLQSQVASIQSRLAGTGRLEQEALPRREKDKIQLTSLEEHLAQVQLKVRKEVLFSIRMSKSQLLEDITDQETVAQEEVVKFQELVDEYKGRLDNTTDQFVKLEELKAKAAETRGILETVRSSIRVIKVESNAPSRVGLVAPVAVPPGGPDYMPRLLAMAVALAASAGLALGLGLWRELTEQKVRSAQELTRLTGIPIIGSIPHAQEDTVPNTTNITLISEKEPLSTLADAYRRVLARLLHADAGRSRIPVLAVVSPSKGDGKSSLASNLGIALARAGRRTLIIDLCYWHHILEKRFDLPQTAGLAEILKRKSTVDNAIHRTHVDNLYILGPGLDSSALVGALASREMHRLLEGASKTFDQVIIDTPPWLIMADARLTTQLCDGVLLVVGSEISTLGMVRRCLRELDEAKANVVGVVLNGARHTVGGYMKANRELYYSYGNGVLSSKSDPVKVPAEVTDDSVSGSGTKV